MSSNTTLTAGLNYTDYGNNGKVVTDFNRMAKNPFIKASVILPYFNTNGDVVKAKLVGFITQGFGYNISNNYEDLLEMTRKQDQISKFLMGLGMTADMLSSIDSLQSFLPNAIQGMSSMKFYSVFQSVTMWQKLNKPEFSIKLLFFDSTGLTDVTKAGTILEACQLPKVNFLGDSGFNMTMTAPANYSPLIRVDSNAENPNKNFSFTAGGTSSVHIQNYVHFYEVICSGINFQYSDLILNTGVPMFLEATFTFKLWRMPLIGDITNRYQKVKIGSERYEEANTRTLEVSSELANTNKDPYTSEVIVPPLNI